MLLTRTVNCFFRWYCFFLLLGKLWKIFVFFLCCYAFPKSINIYCVYNGRQGVCREAMVVMVSKNHFCFLKKESRTLQLCLNVLEGGRWGHESQIFHWSYIWGFTCDIQHPPPPDPVPIPLLTRIAASLRLLQHTSNWRLWMETALKEQTLC